MSDCGSIVAGVARDGLQGRRNAGSAASAAPRARAVCRSARPGRAAAIARPISPAQVIASAPACPADSPSGRRSCWVERKWSSIASRASFGSNPCRPAAQSPSRANWVFELSPSQRLEARAIASLRRAATSARRRSAARAGRSFLSGTV